MQIKIKRLRNDINLPSYKTAGAAGADIEAADNVAMDPGETVLVKTGFSVEIPPGFEMQIRSRSGLAKNGIMVSNSPGTIDSDYRGEVCVLLTNHRKGIQVLEKGTRIAQAVIAPVLQAKWEVSEELSSTERGSGGFGSTGTK